MGSNSTKAKETPYHKNRDMSGSGDYEERKKQHISISNKMVERLVEDASFNSAVEPTPAEPNKTEIIPPADDKETIFMEKLKMLDDCHSERLGLTPHEIHAITNRIEKRLENMLCPEPVCGEVKQEIMQCLTDNPKDFYKCNGIIRDFRKCVREAAIVTLNLRSKKDEYDLEWKRTNLAHARENVLRDLAPQPPLAETDAAA